MPRQDKAGFVSVCLLLFSVYIAIFFSLFPELISSSRGRSHMCCLCLSMLGQVEVPGMFDSNRVVLSFKKRKIKQIDNIAR